MGPSERIRPVRLTDSTTVTRSLVVVVVLIAMFVRLYVLPDVLRPNGVALLGNDPYRIRYHVEQFAASASGLGDLSAFVLPGANPHPLQTVTLGWFTELFGGTSTAAGLVTATYPVIVAMVAVSVAYGSVARLTGSRLTGVLGAAALATAPGYVAYTSFGFGDHHAFDYLWLAATFYGVLLLTDRDPKGMDRWTLFLIGAVGVSIAAQVLAWIAGVLLVVPVGVYMVLATTFALRSARSPLLRVGPLVISLGLAAGLVAAAHVAFGWHPLSIPLLMTAFLLGAVVVVLAGTVVTRRRTPYTAPLFFTGTVVGTVFGGVLVLQFVTEAREFADRGVAYFQRTSGSGIAETASLFGGSNGVVFGPLSQFGFLLFLAIPAALLLTVRLFRESNPRWALPATYFWYFLFLSTVQRRFVGELSLFVALFAAVALVDLTRRGGIIFDRPTFPSLPIRREVKLDASGSLAPVYVLSVVAILVVAASFASIPYLLTPLTVDDEQYAAAAWMDEYAEEQGIPPGNQYVFSPWDTNLMYNYVVNGRSDSYSYARYNYLRFAISRDGEHWYQILRNRDTGFIVTHGTPQASRSHRLQGILHHRLGSGADEAPGASHYRAVYRSTDGTVTAFRPVPGTIVTGSGPANATVTVHTNVSIPGAEFTYRRAVKTTVNGRYGVVVPYPGTYRADARGGSVNVSDRNVQTGTVPHETGRSAYWPLDEGRGTVVFDTVGGHHGSVHDVKWTAGVRNHALSFDGDNLAVISNSVAPEIRDAFTLSLWFRTRNGTDYQEEHPFPRLVSRAPASYVGNTTGYQISMSRGVLLGGVGNGPGAARLIGTSVDDGQWHHAALTWNGTVAKLYVDGVLESQAEFTGDPASNNPLTFGASADRQDHFIGSLDEVRLLDRAQTPAEIREQYNRTAGTRPRDAPA